jgi:hypothetical protein
MTEQKWTKETIRAAMSENTVKGDAWVVKGMLAILNYQTPDEKAFGQTVEDNGVGFNGVDAEILTSFCDQASRVLTSIPTDKYKYSKCLSPKQMEIARKKMLKYSGQLARIANSKSVAPD